MNECTYCGEEGATESMPYVGIPRHKVHGEKLATLWYHNECQLRNVLGGLKHHRQQCSCFVEGGDNGPPDGMTSHEEALEIMRLVQANEWSF